MSQDPDHVQLTPPAPIRLSGGALAGGIVMLLAGAGALAYGLTAGRTTRLGQWCARHRPCPQAPACRIRDRGT